MVETAEQLLDQRHLDAGKLARLRALARSAADRFAAEERLEVDWERIWRIEPILFDETLIGLAEEAIREVSGSVAPAPVRSAARRRRGVAGGRADRDALRPEPPRAVSHTKLEDTRPEHLELSVQALDRLASKTLARLAAG